VESWGESLRERREAAGLTANQLGTRSGVSGETVRRIEAGLTDPSALTRRKIDDALARGSEADRLTRLEREVAELRAVLAEVLVLAERLAGPQEPQPRAGQSGRRR